MFSVVETVENGEKFCSAVPSSWVTGGKLSWPKSKAEQVKGRRLGISPRKDWEQYKCRVIADNIDNFNEALLREQEAENISSSENQESETMQKSTYTLHNCDFNDLVTQLVCSNKDMPGTSVQLNPTGTITYELGIPLSDTESNDITIPLDANMNITTEGGTPVNHSTAAVKENTTLHAIFKEVQQIKGEVLELKKNLQEEHEERIKFEAEIKVALELVLQKLDNNFSDTLLGKNDVNFADIFPLKTLNALEEFDQRLSLDEKWKLELVKKLLTLGGIKPKEMLRALCIFLLEDELLLELSWTGTATKRSFCSFKNTVQLLFTTVRRYHTSFTDNDGAEFFKEYLKHSKTRLQRKRKIEDVASPSN